MQTVEIRVGSDCREDDDPLLALCFNSLSEFSIVTDVEYTSGMSNDERLTSMHFEILMTRKQWTIGDCLKVIKITQRTCRFGHWWS